LVSIFFLGNRILRNRLPNHDHLVNTPKGRTNHGKRLFEFIISIDKKLIIRWIQLSRVPHAFPPVLLCLAMFFPFAGKAALGSDDYRETRMQKDTVPTDETPTRKGIRKYIHILTDKQQRDSLMAKLMRQNDSLPTPDSLVWQRRQNNFAPYRGKTIRNIYYNRVDVFGTVIDDTTYSTSMKLVRFANRLHLNTKEWAIRQALFFRENDTVNAYKMVDNERYLRNLSFIQDARFYIINTYQDPDSIDIVVLTKDLFEYGGTLGNLSPNAIAASIYNNNLFGAGQKVLLGFRWEEVYRPQWRGEVSYSKYNVAGTFADVSFGYSALNDQIMIDTGVYERSYFISINRPLFSSWTKLTGGFNYYYNQSMNVNSFHDSLYRNYQYHVVDLWGGYNFRNQFQNNGMVSDKPNIAIELRQYNLNFTKTPTQTRFAQNPNYNDHHYTLGRIVLFHQDFFKTNYFFGYGRTEDIPSGYNASTTFGIDEWVGIKRSYTAIEVQKYWLNSTENLLSTGFQVGSFWDKGSEDAVIHLQTDYFSRLFRWKRAKLREFFHVDYLFCPNPLLYKPLNINRGNGIQGYEHTTINGYQRLNLGATTTFYSRLSIYGFRFNFFALVQASLLTEQHVSLFHSPLYSGFGLGFSVRNENLSFNTLTFSASYLPLTPHGSKSLFAEISTTIPFSFNIFALQAPALIPFR